MSTKLETDERRYLTEIFPWLPTCRPFIRLTADRIYCALVTYHGRPRGRETLVEALTEAEERFAPELRKT